MRNGTYARGRGNAKRNPLRVIVVVHPCNGPDDVIALDVHVHLQGVEMATQPAPRLFSCGPPGALEIFACF